MIAFQDEVDQRAVLFDPAVHVGLLDCVGTVRASDSVRSFTIMKVLTRPSVNIVLGA
jgi:hypothetical protein